MATEPLPFCDPALVRGTLYASADRLARRTDALHRAKTAGPHAAHTLTELAEQALGDRSVSTAVDIGCGRGTTQWPCVSVIRLRHAGLCTGLGDRLTG